jgi:CRISPR type I-E-associated protein CasB/Cse2
MTPTEAFISKLENLGDGERSLMRRHLGKPLHETLAGFDLFTGLWWPLREKDQRAPGRDTSWLVAKLFCARPVPHKRGTHKHDRAFRLATLLGRVERHEYGREEDSYNRFRARFDALLCSTLATIEPHLDWALGIVRAAHGKGQVPGLDWAQLLDDLWQWERFEKRYLSEDDRDADVYDIRDEWAKHYLNQPDDETPSKEGAPAVQAPVTQITNP